MNPQEATRKQLLVGELIKAKNIKWDGWTWKEYQQAIIRGNYQLSSHDELLEACKATLEHMRQEVNDHIEWADILDNETTICYQLSKAISKAEGTV